jgi:apolipoprotein N-acyltransferase
MLKQKKPVLLLLSLCSGVILALSWPANGFPGLLFIGLVPLLLIEATISEQREHFSKFSVFFYTYPAFFAWNALTTWWIYNSTGIGAILAIVLNSMFMSIVFQAFHYTKVRLKKPSAGYAGLVFYWISFEYLHLNWDLNWPWLNLGNGFAGYYKWVQWYEFTGALGGTLWILVGNIIAYKCLNILGSRFSVLDSRFSLYW